MAVKTERTTTQQEMYIVVCSDMRTMTGRAVRQREVPEDDGARQRGVPFMMNLLS